MPHNLNFNPTTITPQNKIAKMYLEVVLFYEKECKKESKGYVKKLFEISQLAKEKQVTIISKEGRLLKGLYKEYIFEKKINFIIFNKQNSSAIPTIFNKLRNSIAHGNFEQRKIKGTNYFVFFDEYKGSINMKAQIEERIFFDFISELKKSKKA